MKKLRRMTVALLATLMLLSLAAPTFASVLADPNECPYCGIGTYICEPTGEWKMDVIMSRICIHAGPAYRDELRQYTYTDKVYCTNPKCSKHTPKYPPRYETIWYCVYQYGEGMSISPETK